MSDRPVHVRQYEKADGDVSWQVRRTGSTVPTAAFDTKPEAVREGRNLAEDAGVRLTIHRADGSVQTKTDY